MSYTQQRFENFANELPPPPLWVVWVARVRYNPSTNNYIQDGGQIRHFYDLQKAKKYVSPYGRGTFYSDWAIYHWENDGYTKVYEGKQDQRKSDNALFQERVKKETFKPRDIPEDEVQAAIASILQA